MRLFKLTAATIFQHKAWAICSLAVLALPFALPLLSSATERPVLVQPARVQAAWSILWICGLIWGLFAAASLGRHHSKSGAGEYFLTTGTGPSRQLFEIWLALFIYLAPLTLATALVCQFGARPAHPTEQAWWWLLNLQYTCLFLLVIAPLLALAIAVASRFGSISGFCLTILLALYGLYGVGYLDNMLKIEENPVIQGVLLCSPQYRFADLTQRLYFKSGALSSETFATAACYFLGLGAAIAAIARLCFRPKAN